MPALDNNQNAKCTPRAVADEAGNLLSSHDYEPFGVEFPSTRAQSTHRYTEHEKDNEAGLDYMRVRYYGSGDARNGAERKLSAYGSWTSRTLSLQKDSALLRLRL